MTAGQAGQSGCVNWPTPADGYHDSGEGGLWAYVFFKADDAASFADCHTPAGVIALPQQDVVSHDPAEIYERGLALAEYPSYPRDPTTRAPLAQVTQQQAIEYANAHADFYLSTLDAGTSVLAALCLGSTSLSLFSDSRGEYFEVTRDTLTQQGQFLVDQLSAFYGRPPCFVTYLDT